MNTDRWIKIIFIWKIAGDLCWCTCIMVCIFCLQFVPLSIIYISSCNSRQSFTEVTDMHKAEIAIENEELKHHIQCYDSKFLRAHNRLSKLKQEYAESKQYLPPKRYRLLKEMIETVVEDSKLKPDWSAINVLGSVFYWVNLSYSQLMNVHVMIFLFVMRDHVSLHFISFGVSFKPFDIIFEFWKFIAW